MNSLTKSWKTTLGGICLAVGSPLAAAGADWVQTLGIVLSSIGAVLLGGSARDATKSSQDHGVRR